MKTFKTFLNEAAPRPRPTPSPGGGKSGKIGLGLLIASIIADQLNLGDAISGIINKTAENMNRPGPGLGGGGIGTDRGYTSSLYSNPIKIMDLPDRLVHQVEL